MVQLRTILKLADNSGARRLMIIGISHKIGSTASLGDVVLCVVKGADPAGAVTDHEKVRVVIVRTKIRGTRVLGPIAREVKESGFNKIASLAREVV